MDDIIDSLNESYDSFSEIIDYSDTDPLIQIENENNSEFEDSTEDEDEEDHSVPVNKAKKETTYFVVFVPQNHLCASNVSNIINNDKSHI
ncbi:unnamed protein product [Macrosiphum euphorbiae]|uniref:Uncharacterized protein n=1 Tax=Macrosiphum euphorbiae TaxID=13131 RepID=A0AAV0XTW1_9HEMI|nr:unnamed protein product [Macrosiphum euphorbiae]